MIRRVKKALQYSIAVVLFIAAVGKLLDNRYAAELISQWRLLPTWSVLTFTLALSLSEFLLSLWLFSGRYLAQAAIVAIAFHISYTAGTVLTLIRGIHLPDCGCFGIFFAHPLDWVMAVEDFGLTVLSFILFRLASHSSSQPRRPGLVRAAQ